MSRIFVFNVDDVGSSDSFYEECYPDNRTELHGSVNQEFVNCEDLGQYRKHNSQRWESPQDMNSSDLRLDRKTSMV